MKARFFFPSAFLLLLSACAHRSSAPAAAAPAGRPEIVIHAPRERVLLALVIQQKGAGETLASHSDHRLVFVRQVSKPVTYVLTELAPSGAPYVRATYTLASRPHDTQVSVSSELCDNYGTATERSRPLDSPALAREQQNALDRLRALLERP